MIICVTLNPSVDRAVFVERLVLRDANRVIKTETDAGGKGVNVARIVSSLSYGAIATGLLGGGTGEYVKHVLGCEGVKHDFVQIRGETRVNISIEERSGEAPTTLNETGPRISEDEYRAVLNKISGLLEGASFVTAGGSLPPGVPRDAYKTIVELAHQHGVRCAIDSDGEPMKLAVEAKPFFIKPNQREAERLVSRRIERFEDAAKAAVELRSRVPLVVVSMGRKGAVMACDDGLFAATPPIVESKSTIGSGDSMVGAMVVALSKGESFVDALRLGTAAGAATATTDGARIGDAETIRKLLPLVKVDTFALHA